MFRRLEASCSAHGIAIGLRGLLQEIDSLSMVHQHWCCPSIGQHLMLSVFLSKRRVRSQLWNVTAIIKEWLMLTTTLEMLQQPSIYLVQTFFTASPLISLPRFYGVSMIWSIFPSHIHWSAQRWLAPKKIEQHAISDKEICFLGK